MEWSSWAHQFEDIIKGHLDILEEAELHRMCLRLIPAYLDQTAYNIFSHCKNRHDWLELSAELDDAFEDSEKQQNWILDMEAYSWDTSKPLHIYKAHIIRYVNRLKSGSHCSTKALENDYFTHFLAGLPNDYQDFIDQQLFDEERTIDCALKVALRYKSIRKQKEEEAYCNKISCNSNTESPDRGKIPTDGNFHKRLSAGERSMKQITIQVFGEPTPVSGGETCCAPRSTHERLRALEHELERINTHLHSLPTQPPVGEFYPTFTNEPRERKSSSDTRPIQKKYSHDYFRITLSPHFLEKLSHDNFSLMDKDSTTSFKTFSRENVCDLD